MTTVAKIVKKAAEPTLVEAREFAEVPRSLYDENELKIFLMDQLQQAEAERSAIESTWARLQEVYDAPMDTETATFPFEGAANLTVPVVKMNTNTIASALLQTTISPRPAFIFRDLADEWTPFRPLIEKFMDLASRREMKLPKVMESWILEATKLGTSVIQVFQEYTERTYARYLSDGMTVKFVDKAFKDGVSVKKVALADFFIRLYETDIQEAVWCAKRIRLNRRQMEERRKTKFRRPVVDVLLDRGESSTDTDEVTEKKEELSETEPGIREQWEIFEFWTTWTLKNGKSTELLVNIHEDSNEVLSVRFNPYWHGKRPFKELVYFPVEDQFYGDGLCRQLEAMQAEISTTHNQRANNAMLANSRMWKSKRNVRGIRPGDKIYAGKIVRVTDMDDFQPIVMGDVYPSTVANEQITTSYVERLVGLSDPQLRGGLPVTRTTATAQRDLLQESAKRFDQTVRKIREGISFVGEISISLYFQFGAGDKPQRWLGDKGRILDALFRLPVRASELGLGIEAAAPDSQINKQQRRENAIAMFNLTVQMYSQLFQFVGPIVQQINPEALAEVGHALVAGAKQFMGEVYEQFDVTNTEEILAGLSVLERVLPKPEDLGGLESFRAAERDAEVLDNLDRLEAVLRQTGGNGGRREGIRPRVPDVGAVSGTQGPTNGAGAGGQPPSAPAF